MTRDKGADFVLPGHWWRVRLDTDETIRKGAKELALRTFGKADDRARLRAEMTAEVIAAAETARRIDADDFYFALELAPGEVGVPLSLSTAWPMVTVTPSLASSPEVAAIGFAQRLRDSITADEIDAFEGDGYGVVRVITRTPPSGPPEAEEPGRLGVTYWILKPGNPQAFLLSFNTPLLHLEEPALFLTDAIASSVTWRDPETLA